MQNKFLPYILYICPNSTFFCPIYRRQDRTEWMKADGLNRNTSMEQEGESKRDVHVKENRRKKINKREMVFKCAVSILRVVL